MLLMLHSFIRSLHYLRYIEIYATILYYFYNERALKIAGWFTSILFLVVLHNLYNMRDILNKMKKKNLYYIILLNKGV